MKLLESRLRVLGKEDPSTLSTIADIAMVYVQ